MKYCTSIPSSNGTPVTFSFEKTNVTGFAGAPLLVDAIRQSELFRTIVDIFSVVTGRSANPCNLYKDEDLLLQFLLMYGLNCGDVSDAKLLKHDVLIKELLGKIGSSSTLCRYLEEIDRGCRILRGEAERPDYSHLDKYDKERIGSVFFDTINEALLRNKLHCMQKEYVLIAGLKESIPRKTIMLDVDSTFIELHGQQEEKAYCGKNRANGYFPLMMYIENTPVFIHNAPGATDGRKLLENHLAKTLDTIAEIFPNAKVILRADAGFNSEQIIKICEKRGAGYMMGYGQSGKAVLDLMDMLYEQYRAGEYTDGLIEMLPAQLRANIKCNFGLFAQDPKPEDCVDRLCGAFKGYQAKSWTTQRRLYYRIQYSHDYREVDCRFIQTNLTDEELSRIAYRSGQRKNKTSLDHHFDSADAVKVAIDAYDGIYCDRARCELGIREFKAVNESVHLSCKGFFANWAKLAFGVILQQILQETQRIAFPSLSCWRKLSIVSLRKWVLCMPGLVRKYARRLEVAINELMYAMDELWIGLIQQT